MDSLSRDSRPSLHPLSAIMLAVLAAVLIMWAITTVVRDARAAQTETYHQRYTVWSKLHPETPLSYTEWVVAYRGQLLTR